MIVAQCRDIGSFSTFLPLLLVIWYQKKLVEELEGKPVMKYRIDCLRSGAQIEGGVYQSNRKCGPAVQPGDVV